MVSRRPPVHASRPESLGRTDCRGQQVKGCRDTKHWAATPPRTLRLSATPPKPGAPCRAGCKQRAWPRGSSDGSQPQPSPADGPQLQPCSLQGLGSGSSVASCPRRGPLHAGICSPTGHTNVPRGDWLWCAPGGRSRQCATLPRHALAGQVRGAARPMGAKQNHGAMEL